VRALALALALCLAGCETVPGAAHREPRERRPPTTNERAIAATITDAWQARTFGKKNRHKRSRRVCADNPEAAVCSALSRKHRKAERRERR
jgi:starvation-inducible outer membrane lipoprotein